MNITRLLWTAAGLFLACQGKSQNHDWIRFFGDTSTSNTSVSVKQVSSGSFFHVGRADIKTVNNTEIQFSKHDASGQVSWIKSLSTGSSVPEYPEYLNTTADGNFIICGQSVGSTSDMLLLKADTNGKVIWRQQYDLNGDNQTLEYVEPTADKGFIAAGYTNQADGKANDLLVVKFDSLGALEWYKLIGNERNETGHCIHQTSDGGYAVTGDKQQASGFAYEMYLAKLKPDGDIEWDLAFTDKANTGNQAFILDKTGNYILVGEGSTQGNTSFDVALAKVSAQGQLLWYKKSGLPGAEAGFYLVQNEKKEFLITGYSTSNVNSARNNAFLAKFDSTGICVGAKYFPMPFAAIGNDLIATADSGYCIATNVHGSYCLIHTTDSAYTTTFSETWDATTGIRVPSAAATGVEIYPNPAHSVITLKAPGKGLATITDVTGRKLLETNVTHLATLDIHSFPEGLYFLIFYDPISGERATCRILKN